MNDEPSSPRLGAPLAMSEEQPRQRHSTRLRWFRGALVSVLMIVVVVVGVVTASAQYGWAPAIIPALHPDGVGPSATAAKTPTATATPRIGCYQNGGAESAFTCYATDGTSMTAPDLPGLAQSLRQDSSGQTVIYIAQAGNPYGMATNHYAGEYRTNVVVTLPGAAQSTQTGGLALAPAVALYLLKQGLAHISAPGSRWLIMLPVDIHGPSGPASVEIFFHAYQPKQYFLSIDYAGVAAIPNMIAPVANTFPTNHSLIEQTDGRGYSGIGTNFPPYYTKVWPGREMSYITVRWGNPALKFNWTLNNTDFGDQIASASSPIEVMFGSIQQAGSITPDRVLCVGGSLGSGGVPVFLNVN